MRGLEGPGHLLRSLEAGLAEPCPRAAKHLELPGRPTPIHFWQHGQSRLAKIDSCPGAGEGPP